MRASSQAALELAQERWEPVLREVGERASVLGGQLFGVVDALDSAAALRRALTEPTRDGADKADLVTAVLGAKVDQEVVDLVAGLVRERWSAAQDLADAVDSLATDSVLAAAQQAGRLEEVEDETFRLVRILGEERALRIALGDRHETPERRAGLAESVLGGKIGPETALLVTRAARALRDRSLVSTLRSITEAAAERRRHLVASVTAVVPLDRTQIDRLQGYLSRRYDRAVQIYVGLDPAVLGGVRVQVGDDVIDGTLASRLADARRRIAG